MLLIPFQKEDALLCVDLPMRNKKKEIVCVTTVSAEDYEWARLSSWSLTGGYAYGSVSGKNWYLHRLVMQRNNVQQPSMEQNCVDHMDGNRLNNTLPNLRWVTVAQNHKNRNRGKNNTSGCSGVTFNKKSNKWIARITNHNQ